MYNNPYLHHICTINKGDGGINPLGLVGSKTRYQDFKIIIIVIIKETSKKIQRNETREIIPWCH